MWSSISRMRRGGEADIRTSERRSTYSFRLEAGQGCGCVRAGLEGGDEERPWGYYR